MKCSRFLFANRDRGRIKLTSVLLTIVGFAIIYSCSEKPTAATDKAHTQMELAQKWVPPTVGFPRRTVGGGTR